MENELFQRMENTKRGRKPKYDNEEDRKKAIQESWRKAQEKRKEKVLEYIKIWRNNNRDHVNELAREYARRKREI